MRSILAASVAGMLAFSASGPCLAQLVSRQEMIQHERQQIIDNVVVECFASNAPAALMQNEFRWGAIGWLADRCERALRMSFATAGGKMTASQVRDWALALAGRYVDDALAEYGKR